MELAGTYENLRKQIFETDGKGYPSGTLIKLELEPGYERARNRLLPYIQAVNEAHVIMLREQAIIKESDAGEILRALIQMDLDEYRKSEYDGHYEDLYFRMEHDLIRKSDGAAGNMHLGRSRNDMCVAWSHMAVREELLHVMGMLLRLQNAVTLFSTEHKDTLYVIHTHTQHAQPGLLGHYFLGVADVLDRNFKRLSQAYDAVNVSPMGAAAVTTTGFPISRQRVAELTGFEGVIENAYDAIGNCDYFTQTASAAGLCALDLGRVVTDLVLWATQEMNMIRVSDGYISTSSIMPQKRNPIALEHLRASLSMVKGLADAVLTGFVKTPYGDISDYEDIEDSMSLCLGQLGDNLNLFYGVIGTMDVNKELLEQRAYESFSVVTEIADQMYRNYQIPFRTAHSFVSVLVKKAEEKQYNMNRLSKEFFAGVYQEFFGKAFEQDFTPISEAIDPWHFVRCRQVYGGTGHEAMETMIRDAEIHVKRNHEWMEDKENLLYDAERNRREALEHILGIDLAEKK